jgi:hypothetical protein
MHTWLSLAGSKLILVVQIGSFLNGVGLLLIVLFLLIMINIFDMCFLWVPCVLISIVCLGTLVPTGTSEVRCRPCTPLCCYSDLCLVLCLTACLAGRICVGLVV